MEALGPAVIGQQFVRQYYTLLNKDPAQLHRLYLDNSIFVHTSENGQDDSVVGQKAIFERITTLNFVNCCTRIRQVDAFATVSDSIVIQVIGELSNNQEPLRPFVQTFVLVPQGSKKYYVHNDIFRYQDFIVEPEAEETVDAEEALPSSEPAVFYSTMTNGPPTVVDVPAGAETMPLSSDDSGLEQANTVPNDVLPTETEDLTVQDQPIPPVENDIGSSYPAEEPALLQEEPEQPRNFSYANVAQGKKSRGPPPQAPAPTQMPAISVPVSTAANAPLPQRQSRRNPNTEGQSSRSAAGNGRTSGRGHDLSDSHQLFVRNIPPGAEVDDIKKVFEPHGNVVDVRTTSKNFCFVIFKNAEDVSRILKERVEIKMDGVTLSVDEKKQVGARRGGAGSTGRVGRGSGRNGRGGNDRH